MIVDEFFSSNLYVFQCFILVLDVNIHVQKLWTYEKWISHDF